MLQTNSLCLKCLHSFVCVISLTEYVTVDKQILEEILREVSELKKLAATPVPTTTVIEEIRPLCSAELAVEQK